MSRYIDKSLKPLETFAKTRAAKVLTGLWLIGGVLVLAVTGLFYQDHFGPALGVWIFGPIGAVEAALIAYLGFLLLRDGIKGKPEKASG